MLTALLEWAFPLGIGLTALVVLLHSVLAFGAVLAIERLAFGSALPSSAGLVLFAGVAAAVYLFVTTVSRLRAPVGDAPAVAIEPSAAPALFTTIGDVARRLGVKPPSVVLVGPTMSFTASRGPVRALDGPVSGDILYLSIPAMAVLSAAQFGSTLAHELAHFRNGDVDVGSRLAPSLERIAAAIEALEQESDGVGRVAAWAGIRWLRFAASVMETVVGQRRRDAEAAADAVAAQVVGPAATTSGLLLGYAVSELEPEWAAAVQAAIERGDELSVEAFAERARALLTPVEGRDVVLQSLGDLAPQHPALLTRIRALGLDPEGLGPLEVPHEGVLRSLVLDPDGELDRVIRALRALDARHDAIELNTPRLTPGIVGWIVSGLVFGAIFVAKSGDGGPTGEMLKIIAVVAAVWLAFPIAYPFIQREVAIDKRGIRIRPWWSRWLDPGAARLRWKEIRWTDSMTLRTRLEDWVTLSNGLDSVSWWAAVWPRREMNRLTDGLRQRRVHVDFGSSFGTADVDRDAVLWTTEAGFLMPTVRRGPDGGLLEMRPVKRVRDDVGHLANGLIDSLTSPIKAAGARDAIAHPADLAQLAGLELDAFEASARRIAIHGSRDAWEITIDGVSDAWVPRRTNWDDLARVVRELRDYFASPSPATGELTEDPPASPY